MEAVITFETQVIPSRLQGATPQNIAVLMINERLLKNCPAFVPPPPFVTTILPYLYHFINIFASFVEEFLEEQCWYGCNVSVSCTEGDVCEFKIGGVLVVAIVRLSIQIIHITYTETL
jgi:hypothetical protein